MFTVMRSNDVFLGLPHDIFCFTMLQEMLARTLGMELGVYKHAVGSLHLYSESIKDAADFMNEGWQSTDQPMPPMPAGDPWSNVKLVLSLEASIRAGKFVDDATLSRLDPYWADLIRLLRIYNLTKSADAGGIQSLMDQMVSDVYDPFITARIAAVSAGKNS